MTGESGEKHRWAKSERQENYISQPRHCTKKMLKKINKKNNLFLSYTLVLKYH